MRPFSWTISALLLFLVAAETAQGQRLIVRTTTLSAAREATRAYIQSVDMTRQEALPMPIRLPAPVPIGRLLPTPDMRFLVASSTLSPLEATSFPRSGLSFTSGIQVSPFQSLAGATFISNDGWREFAACWAVDPSTLEPLLIMLAQHSDSAGIVRGHIEMRRFNADLVPSDNASILPLPGIPIAATTVGNSARVAVLCHDPDQDTAFLYVRDVASNIVQRERVSLAPDGETTAQETPAALCASKNGAYLFVLTSLRNAAEASGRTISRLYCLESKTLAPLGEAVQISGGSIPSERSLVSPTEDACWVLTREPSLEFGYVTRVRVAPPQLLKDVEHSVTRVTRPLLLAANPRDDSVVVATESRVKIWRDNNPTDLGATMAQSVGALAWTLEGLFVGEGNCVHQLDPTSLEIRRTVSLQSGQVSDVFVVSPIVLPQTDPDADGAPSDQEAAVGTDPTNPDSDGDGLSDGADPEPLRRTLRLDVPPVLTFYGEAVGHELQAFTFLSDASGLVGGFRVTYDREQMPWLRVHPFAGTLPGIVYMGIDAGAYGSPQRTIRGVLDIATSGAPVLGSPASVLIRILPQRNDVSLLLWLTDSQDSTSSRGATEFDMLQRLLSGPPMFSSHRRTHDSLVDSLEAFSIVIADVSTVTSGLVTRQMLLDYVAEGGALLFLGEYMESGATSSYSEQWLAPLGIHVNPAIKVEGTFSSDKTTSPARYWRGISITDGCSIRVDDTALIQTPLAEDGDKAIFASTLHGRGRIAVLASSTPLENEAMANESNRRFATHLFDWLLRAGEDINDLDADGLQDRLEDKNGNSVLDVGETDWLNPDTDSDGVPDGAEDANRNGLADVGETIPVNPDSDGDGVWDGADVQPVPSPDAPYITRVAPTSTPAEGGCSIMVTGKNFAPGCEISIGNRKALNCKFMGADVLVGEAPPSEGLKEASVDVRVTNAMSGLAGALPGAFQYSPLSTVRLTLHAANASGNVYQGAIVIGSDTSDATAVGRISLRLETEPPRRVQWGNVVPGAGAEFAGRRVVQRPAPSGGLWVDISTGAKSAAKGDLVWITWSTTAPVDVEHPIQFRCEGLRVFAVNGVLLQAESTPLTVSSGGP